MSLKRADKFSVVSVTIADAKQAQKLSEVLLKDKLCACVHIVPKVTSLYWWEGKITQSDESWLIIKTHQSKIRELLEAIEKLHPYDVPEILELKPGLGSSTYLEWIMTSVGMHNP